MNSRISRTIQIGLHAVRNSLGEDRQLSLFSDHSVREYCEEYGVELEGSINRFGVDLTDMQARVMEGILKAFTDTSYKGNIEPVSKEKLAIEKFSGKLPPVYNNITEIPRIRVTQADLLEFAGMKKKGVASWARALEALKELGTKQFYFYYDRLMTDSNGVPLRERDGKKYKKESVTSVDTLFVVKEIRNTEDGALKYYEIMPSPLFLDQRESYFMIVPYKWREEVRIEFGQKKASAYTFQFLIFLRYQYELQRRSKKPSPAKIVWAPEEICIALKMPESVYKRKKKRALEILEDAYFVAKKLGYLSSYETTELIHTLILNDSKYYPMLEMKEVQEKSPSSSLTDGLLECFYTLKKAMDAAFKKPNMSIRAIQKNDFEKLLETRNHEQIESVMKWGMTKNYWCTRLSTTKNIVTNFNEAFVEYSIEKSKDPEYLEGINKKFAQEKLAKFEHTNFKSGARICLLNKYVEITPNGPYQAACVNYSEKNFQEALAEALKKHQIPMKVLE